MLVIKGLEDYDDSVLARVLAESQEEYFRQLKKQQQQQQHHQYQQQNLHQQGSANSSSESSGTSSNNGSPANSDVSQNRQCRQATNEGASTSRCDSGSGPASVDGGL